MTEPTARPISEAEYDALFQQVSNWGRWGVEDQIGSLNLITPEKRQKAASLVSEGVSVNCALPLNTQGGAENPSPVVHLMIRAGDLPDARGATDFIAMAPHGLSLTHLDALCHIFYKGQMYNGRPGTMVTSSGALANSIESGTNGIVSRGVLFDMPRILGKDWLEPGETIYAEDFDKAEEVSGVHIEPGDILLVRTGRHKRREALGVAGAIGPSGMAGIHSTAMPWVRDHGVAVLGGDGDSDVRPSGYSGGGIPLHTLAIAAMGMNLLDNAQFDDLAEACARFNRWEFLLTIAPLRLLRGTASPVNPIALF